MHSKDDHKFHAAFLELYAHELLLRSGHRIALHPELQGTNKRPDFSADDGSGVATVFECTVVTELSDAERARRNIVNRLYDAINQIQSLNFFISLDCSGYARSPVPHKKWLSTLNDWLGALNVETVTKTGVALQWDDLPTLNLVHDGLEIVVTPVAKRSPTHGRLIGVLGSEGALITSHQDIAQAIRKKAGRYGAQPGQYVIVVNCLGELCDLEEIDLAIQGQVGIWPLGSSPKHTRVSAVLAIHHLLPWSVATAPVTLYHNPDARLPYRGPLTKLPQVTKGIRIEGVRPNAILGLPDAWPGT